MAHKSWWDRRSVSWRFGRACALVLLALVSTGLNACNSGGGDEDFPEEEVLARPTVVPRVNMDIAFQWEDPADRNLVLHNPFHYVPIFPLEAAVKTDLAASGMSGEFADKALATYRSYNMAYLSGDYPEATRLGTELVKAAPTGLVRTSRATLAIVEGKWDAAAADLNEALAKTPDDPSALQLKAFLLYRRGQLDEAERIASSLTSKRDTLQSLWTLLGVIHLGQNQPKKAANDLQRATQIFPNNPVVWYHRGTMGVMDSTYREALAAFTKARDLNPRSPDTLLRLAKVQIRSNQLEYAADTLKKFEEMKPTDKRGFLLLAAVYRYQQNFKAAAAEYQSVLKVFPQDMETCMLVVEMLHSQSKFAQAIPLLDRFNGFYPGNHHILRMLATSYLRSDKHEEAVKYFNQAIGVNANDVDCYVDLGKAYAALKRTVPAVEAYNKALEVLGVSDANKEKAKTIQDLITLVQVKPTEPAKQP